MSWSINAVGRAGAVAGKVASEIVKIKCSEPEETIKNAVGAILATALSAYPEGYAVSVEANGSQGPGYDSATGANIGGHVNSLTVNVRPLYGFVI